MPYKDIEKRKKARREYYAKNRTKMREYFRNWNRDNREANLARQARYRENHRGEIRARLQSNPNKKQYYYRSRERIKIIHSELRSKALELLGGKCEICGRTGCRLNFHHKSYTPEEALKHSTNYWKMIRNLRCVLKEPERFVLLCSYCHSIVTWFQVRPELVEKTLQILRQSHLPSEALGAPAKLVRPL